MGNYLASVTALLLIFICSNDQHCGTFNSQSLTNLIGVLKKTKKRKKKKRRKKRAHPKPQQPPRSLRKSSRQKPKPKDRLI